MFIHANTTEDALVHLETPRGTKSWSPLPHTNFMGTIVDKAWDAGFEMVDTQLELADGSIKVDGELIDIPNARLFGTSRIIYRNTELQKLANENDYHPILGYRNSNDKHFRAEVYLGSKVVMCSNLMASASIAVFRKHVGHILNAFNHTVDQAFVQLGEAVQVQDTQIATYKCADLKNFFEPQSMTTYADEMTEKVDPDRVFNDLAIKAMQGGILPATKLPKLVGNWEEPTHDAFKDKTVWSAMNAFTETFKDYKNPSCIREMKLNTLLDSYAACC